MIPPPPLPPVTGPPTLADLKTDDGRPGLVLLVGLVVTGLVCVGLVGLWPKDDATVLTESTADAFADFAPAVPGATGEPSRGPLGGVNGGTTGPDVVYSGPSLFAGGAPQAVADVIRAAGGPSQFIEIVLYPGYTFVAYRDPAAPDHIDERMWREGNVDDARANPIDDRVNADTEPELFTAEEFDLALIPQLVADAVTRYGMPVEVTHVIIDRFLPFDERVLVRVYASPSDDRSGGGYVSYDRAGTLVKVCC